METYYLNQLKDSYGKKLEKYKEDMEIENSRKLEIEKRKLAKEMEKDMDLQLKTNMIEREKLMKANLYSSLETFKNKMKNQISREYKDK